MTAPLRWRVHALVLRLLAAIMRCAVRLQAHHGGPLQFTDRQIDAMLVLAAQADDTAEECTRVEEHG